LILEDQPAPHPGLGPDEILAWLRETNAARLKRLWRAATKRAAYISPTRCTCAAIEISNCCVRQCGYCGLRAGNPQLARHRMTEDEIVACAHKARAFGYGTTLL
jgi:biotin synthase